MPYLVEIGPCSDSWFFRRRFLKNRHCFFTMLLLHVVLYPLGKDMALHLNKLKFKIRKDDLRKLAQWIWRRRFFKVDKAFSLIRNYLPLRKCLAKQNIISFTQEWFVEYLVEIVPPLLEKIFNICECFFTLCLYNYWGVALYLNKLESPSLKAALIGWCGQLVLEQKIF